ncbi:MAG: hypothetical protein D4Q79_01425 [Spirochaetia bacterium]|nr:MAG: hypothetical protein D4Q79_01425 [Spirochaetia bacterium]
MRVFGIEPKNTANYNQQENMTKSIIFSSTWNIIWPILINTWPYLLLLLLLAIVTKFTEPKTIRYFLRRNKIEILTAFFALLGYIINYYFVKRPDYSLFLNASITLVAMAIFVSSKTKEKDFYFISLKRRSDKDDWIGDGIFQYERTHDAYAITNSHSGVIFPKCLTWSDYKLEFDFKILKTSLGVILRATNLSNLVMLQIFDTGIKAHIRIHGFWQAWDKKETQLEFEKKLNLDNWYFCSIQCDKNSIRIRIHEWVERPDPEDSSKSYLETNQIFDRVWKIPSGNISYTWKRKEITEPEAVVPFPINLEYGTFGFRNDRTENALIRNVLIEKI